MATLYRKYRSKTFDDIIGQEPIVTTLTNQIKLGRIGHAYLFTGSRGVGKTSCARIFARAVNCENPINGSPCGKCAACKALDAADCVDIIEMDAASNNGVDDAREIREKVKYMPVSCRYKVYIIDEAHMLTGGAFNALLKTIEEPPEHVIFILATTEPQKLPQTILSRCLRFDFKLVPMDVLSAHIARVYDAEGIKYTKDAAEEIARLGEGSVRDALSVADMLASAADVITPEVVRNLTGAGDGEAIAELYDSAAVRDIGGCLKAVDALAASGKSMAAVCRQLNVYARNTLVIKAVGRDKASSGVIVNLDRAAFDRVCASADKTPMQDASAILEGLGAAENGLKYSVNPRLYLETALVGLVCGAAEKDDLKKRVAALEKRLSAAGSAEQKKNNVVFSPPPAPKKAEPVPEPKPVHAPVEKPREAADKYADYPEPPPEIFDAPPEPSGDYAPPRSAQAAPSYAPPQAQPVQRKTPETVVPIAADEGEFMHRRAETVSGMALLGKITRYLRKNPNAETARARELLSRGVTVKEREDAIAFVTADENFLSLGEPSVIATLNAALDDCGEKRRARAEKTDEDLYHDDLMRARELFGRDNVVPKPRDAR